MKGLLIGMILIYKLTRRVFNLERHIIANGEVKRVILSRHHNDAAADAEAVEQRVEAAKFRVGEVVEQIYNTHSLRSRVLYPLQVEEINFTEQDEDRGEAMPRYTLVRLVDGHRVERALESSLRQYLPYSQDTLAACNFGGYGKAQILLPCSIREYIQSSNEYRVRIEGEEVERNLPIEKLQRHA